MHGLELQLGGGIRSAADVEWALEAGAGRVLIGSLAGADPTLVGELAGRPPAESRSPPTAATAASAPTAGSGTPSSRRGRSCAGLTEAGVRDFLVTAIGRDGTGLGPDIELLRSCAGRMPGLLIAAGGVGSAAHVDAAVAAGADAVVVGRALLDGTIAFGIEIRYVCMIMHHA